METTYFINFKKLYLSVLISGTSFVAFASPYEDLINKHSLANGLDLI